MQFLRTAVSMLLGGSGLLEPCYGRSLHAQPRLIGAIGCGVSALAEAVARLRLMRARAPCACWPRADHVRMSNTNPTSIPNTGTIDRNHLVDCVRAAQAALGPIALDRFDAWSQGLGGEIHEFGTFEAIERAFVQAEGAELDARIVSVLRRLAGRPDDRMSAVDALRSFRTISRDRARRMMAKHPRLLRLVRCIDNIMWVLVCSAAFVLVSEAACELSTRLLHR